MTTKKLFAHLVKLGKEYQSRGASYVYDVVLTESSLMKPHVVGHYNVEKMAIAAWVASAV